jgi:hypothetical protein
MAIKTIYQNPSITDQVVIPLPCPDANGCFFANPYKVDKVTIYYLQTDFTTGGTQEISEQAPSNLAQQNLNNAVATWCADPTADNLAAVQTAQGQIATSGTTNTFYYTQANPVTIVGSPLYPAWLSSDVEDALITHVTKDANGNTQYGHFLYDWQPEGVREGNYYVCWTWTPLPAGTSLSAHVRFALSGNTDISTSIPIHRTTPGKYITLLERYTPEMFNMTLSAADLTPSILTRFNVALSNGFTLIEDLANQLIDLIDANVVTESVLPLLSNLFDLKLKSTDVTRWRRQTKTAIPYFKSKGTLKGLADAMAAAGIRLRKLTLLWQVISLYTWVDDFLIDTPPQSQFVLSRIALPIDPLNFQLSYRRNGSASYEDLDSSYVSFTSLPGQTVMNWLGETNPAPIRLQSGDRIKVLYQYAPVPSYFEQQVENYVRMLPLADQRDENSQDYPLKNWNVRVIEQDDPLFDLVIKTRFPFINFLVFGKIRTEFPYSENLYNSDEYNGSKRNSKLPCDIDKDFVDPCSYCQGSEFTIDIEIDELSNDRIVEAQNVITEYAPFHAVLHSLNLAGGQEDFIQSPVEDIQSLVQVSGVQVVLGGMGQTVFNRARFYGLSLDVITREMLANVQTSVASELGSGYNARIVMYAQNCDLNETGVNPAISVLEIMAPHPQAGVYSVSDLTHHTAVVNGVVEPLNQSAFTFRLSNNYYQNSTTSIFQDNIYNLTDPNVHFLKYEIKTQWDVDHGYAGPVWKVAIPGFMVNSYPILNVLPDGSLLLDDSQGGLPSTNLAVNYKLLDGGGNTVVSSVTGVIQVTPQGRIEIADANFTTLQGYLLPGYWVLYNGTQYQITGYVHDEPMQFYIAGYTGGNVAGVSIDVYQRLFDNEIGTLGYEGMILVTPYNYEQLLNIQNGSNPPVHVLENNSFKENYLVVINGSYFAIAGIDGNTMTLVGPHQNWTLAGVPITFGILHYEKVIAQVSNSVTNPYFDSENNQVFTQLDRSGYEFITNEIQNASMFWMNRLNMQKPGGEKMDELTQKEAVSFHIDYLDGSVADGEIQ